MYICSFCIWADFQLGDKPFGALELCSVREDNDHVSAVDASTPACVSVTIQSKQTKTPCILRRRRRKLCTNGKKSVVHGAKSSAGRSPAGPAATVSRDCSRVSDTGSESCVTPKKDDSEPILPFSPSQVWVFSFSFVVKRSFNTLPWVTCGNWPLY